MSMVKVIGNGTPCVMSTVRKKPTYGPDKICMRKRKKNILNKKDRMDVAQTLPLILLLYFQQNGYIIKIIVNPILYGKRTFSHNLLKYNNIKRHRINQATINFKI